jgi:7-cyano-7-deazaguanine synthase in queuosine biosynthesis
MNIIGLSDNTTLRIPEGPVGISCSGGTDSSLLLYLLMSNCKDTVHIFTLSNNLKGRSNAVIVPKVIERCIQLTGNINVIHYSWYAEDQSEESLFDFQRQALREQKIKTIFSAVTANPPVDIKFQAGVGEHYLRNPNIVKDEISFDGYFLTPFINKNKQTIAKIYQDLDLMETLFPVTRSCEELGKIEYYEHCGKCWWCEERLWGFGRV